MDRPTRRTKETGRQRRRPGRTGKGKIHALCLRTRSGGCQHMARQRWHPNSGTVRRTTVLLSSGSSAGGTAHTCTVEYDHGVDATTGRSGMETQPRSVPSPCRVESGSLGSRMSRVGRQCVPNGQFHESVAVEDHGPGQPFRAGRSDLFSRVSSVSAQLGL